MLCSRHASWWRAISTALYELLLARTDALRRPASRPPVTPWHHHAHPSLQVNPKIRAQQPCARMVCVAATIGGVGAGDKHTRERACVVCMQLKLETQTDRQTDVPLTT